MNSTLLKLKNLKLERGTQSGVPAATGNKDRSIWVPACAVGVLACAGFYFHIWPGAETRARGTADKSAISEPTPVVASRADSRILEASGYVVARRQATVSSKVTGRAASVPIEEGMRVSAGQVIAQLEDSNARALLAEATQRKLLSQARQRAAQSALNNAAPTYERASLQFDRRMISAQDFDQAQAILDAAQQAVLIADREVSVAEASVLVAKAGIEDTIVRAPFSGVVTVKAAQAGEIVSPISAGGGFTRTGICTIVDMTSLEVDVDVSENFINRVNPGLNVTVIPNAYPGLVLPARVEAIVPTADRAKATVKVRIKFETLDDRIVPEMGVKVTFQRSPAADSVELGE